MFFRPQIVESSFVIELLLHVMCTKRGKQRYEQDPSGDLQLRLILKGTKKINIQGEEQWREIFSVTTSIVSVEVVTRLWLNSFSSRKIIISGVSVYRT
jgi:hypothetical protein